jgi:hypothetical protein
MSLSYPTRDGRDRIAYRAYFTLDPGAAIDPPTEEFRLKVETPTIVLADLAVPAGQIFPSSATGFTKFRSPEPGITTISLRQVGPSHYAIRLSAKKLDMPPPDELLLIVSITLGDDTLSHEVPIVVRRGGKRFVSLD